MNNLSTTTEPEAPTEASAGKRQRSRPWNPTLVARRTKPSSFAHTYDAGITLPPAHGASHISGTDHVVEKIEQGQHPQTQAGGGAQAHGHVARNAHAIDIQAVGRRFEGARGVQGAPSRGETRAAAACEGEGRRALRNRRRHGDGDEAAAAHQDALNARIARGAASRFASAGIASALALLILVVFALHLRGIGGDFLSDDFSHLSVVARNDEQGRLGAWVVERFLHGLDNGNFAFRPIAFASYALDWRLFGADAAGWHATNLALYVANALVGAWLVGRWLRGRGERTLGACLIAAAALVAFPFAGEISFWPVGRFDLLAALFSLLYLHALPPAARASAATHGWRVLWLLCALLSKESAMPLPLVASLVCYCAEPGAGMRSASARLRVALRETAPTWVAFAAYLGYRAFLFGSPWKVYPDSTPPHGIAEWFDRIWAVRHVVQSTLGGAAMPWVIVAAGLSTVAIVFALRNWQQRVDTPSLLGIALLMCAAMYAVAPSFGFGLAAPNGEGARLLYLAWVYASLAFGVVAASSLAAQWTLVGLLAVATYAEAESLGKWQAAAHEMKRVTSRVAALGDRVPRGAYALLLLPDHIGNVVFARNAQGGIVSRPSQPADYLNRMAVMVENGFTDWSALLLTMASPGVHEPASIDAIEYASLYCWRPESSSFVRLPGGVAARDPVRWQSEALAQARAVRCLGDR